MPISSSHQYPQDVDRNKSFPAPTSHGAIQVKRGDGDAGGGAARGTSNGDGDRWGPLGADKCPRRSCSGSYIWRGE
ncbi:hypothetical protein F2Q68_00019679 [Brassica cretica]|uniref:Uncharacterized protein n=1 Tax=Brassica cretica TaxID=69181 RepID=A0A8S9FZA3_BRACR|nr:hypothetical protein F2Q68_00019679 [Brassica cretica]